MIEKIMIDYVWWVLKRVALGILIVFVLAVSLVSCTGFAAYPF